MPFASGFHGISCTRSAGGIGSLRSRAAMAAIVVGDSAAVVVAAVVVIVAVVVGCS